MQAGIAASSAMAASATGPECVCTKMFGCWCQPACLPWSREPVDGQSLHTQLLLTSEACSDALCCRLCNRCVIHDKFVAGMYMSAVCQTDTIKGANNG